MAPKTKTRYVEINANKDSFVSKLIGPTKTHDFSDIQLLRSLLSNEKSRILYTLKHNKPPSIYKLAKQLGRDFKSVRNDLMLLKRFGFITFTKEKRNGRECLTPELSVNRLQIQVDV